MRKPALRSFCGMKVNRHSGGYEPRSRGGRSSSRDLAGKFEMGGKR